MKISVFTSREQNSCSILKINGKTNSFAINLGLPYIEEDGAKYFYSNLNEVKSKNLLKNNLIPDCSDIYNGMINLSGILLSQPYFDYHGILKLFNANNRVFLGISTKKILQISSLFSPQKYFFKKTNNFTEFQSFFIGNFKITPFLNDHSTLDAYFFLIESEGKSIFYYGDFYGHRRRKKIIEWLKRNQRKNVDAIILDCPVKIPQESYKISENDIFNQTCIYFKEKNRINFIFTSGFNLIRFISIYNAAKISQKILIVDLQIAYILYNLAILNKKSAIPYPGKDADDSFFKVFYPVSLSNQLIKNGQSKILYQFENQKITNVEIERDFKNIVMFVRPQMKDDIEHIHLLHSGNIIYSLSEELLKKRYNKDFIDYLLEMKFIFRQLVTSGHDELSALTDVLKVLKPKKIVTINDVFSNFSFLKNSCNLFNLQNHDNIEV